MKEEHRSLVRYFLRRFLPLTLLAFATCYTILQFSSIQENLQWKQRTKQIFWSFANSSENEDEAATAMALERDTPQCLPNEKVIFAKTHKTGSSTVQNILMRFGFSHDLHFVLPKKRNWLFPLLEQFSVNMVMNYLEGVSFRYDMMVLHHIWNSSEIRKLIPEGIAITILRDPVETFESGYAYLNFKKFYGMDVNEFAIKLASRGLRRPQRTSFHRNSMLYDLGLNQSFITNPKQINEKIKQLDKEFDLVMIAEQMDESLIMLADLLCWPLHSVSYLSQNVRKASAKSKLTPEAKLILKEWLRGDYVLYNHFLEKFERTKKKFGIAKLNERLETFAQLNKDLMSSCVLDVADNSKLMGKYKTAIGMVYGYIIDESKDWCKYYAVTEPAFFMEIYDRQREIMKIPYRPLPQQ